MKSPTPEAALAEWDPAVSLVVCTAGHIDHGKTSLVQALTGTDTDRLPEEKRRGITIDLGFAALDLHGPKEEAIEISFVDVPGHHAFLQNMIAGVGGVNAVLLVIAADEGVRAQTLQHLAICTLLGVQRGVVVLTKSDAVTQERLVEARVEAVELVRGTPFRNAPIVLVSSLSGEGLEELKAALTRMALERPSQSTESVLRLPLDRAFSVTGFGTVATGTLHDSLIRAGDLLELQPRRQQVRVRGLQVHRRATNEALAPRRVAVNLAGVEMDEVHRGDMVVSAGTVVPTTVVDVELTELPGATAVRHRKLIGVHAFTTESSARVLLYDGMENPNTPRLARLRLAKPMTLVPGDRLVLRRLSPVEILGGGRVLDAQPDLRLRKPATQRWLDAIRRLEPSAQIVQRVLRCSTAGITASVLVRETGLTMTAVLRIAKEACDEGELLAAGQVQGHASRYIASIALKEASERLLKELNARPTLSSSWAELLSKTMLHDWVLDLAVSALRNSKLVRTVGGQIELEDASTVDTKQTELLNRVENLYRNAGLGAPIVEEAAAQLKLHPKELTPLLTMLLRAGKLVRMGEDRLLIHIDAINKLKDGIRAMRGRTINVARFKELTGLTRKHAIPLLEYLDRTRVTSNRQGIRTVL